jgi:hypothetical protein
MTTLFRIPRRPETSSFVAAFAVAALALAGCTDSGPGSPDDGDPVAMPSFQVDVQPILSSPTCVSSSCHSASRRAGGLSLEGVEPADLIDQTADDGVVLVVPFDAKTSYLVRKLEGRDIQGGRMPLGRPSLSESQTGTIRNWIDQGAQDD